jgi:hypothetical protein
MLWECTKLASVLGASVIGDSEVVTPHLVTWMSIVTLTTWMENFILYFWQAFTQQSKFTYRVVLHKVTSWDETSAMCPLPSGALTMDGPLPHTVTLALTKLHSCKPISHLTSLDLSILHPLAHKTFSRSVLYGFTFLYFLWDFVCCLVSVNWKEREADKQLMCENLSPLVYRFPGMSPFFIALFLLFEHLWNC